MQNFLGDVPTKISNDRLSLKFGFKWEQQRKDVRKFRKEIIASITGSANSLSFLDGSTSSVKAPVFHFSSGLLRSLENLETPFWKRREYISRKWNFEEGKVLLKKKEGKEVSLRIGKYLKLVENFWQGTHGSYLATLEAQDEWECKEVDWNWRISTNPKDIFTISTNRPWISCMKFEEDSIRFLCGYSYIGAGVLFFERNDHVCGRRLLVPCFKGKTPYIYIDDLYGSGASLVQSQKIIRDLIKNYRTKNFPIKIAKDLKPCFWDVEQFHLPILEKDQDVFDNKNSCLKKEFIKQEKAIEKYKKVFNSNIKRACC